nr:amidohydrolase family protein [Rhodopirellula sp. JC639]
MDDRDVAAFAVTDWNATSSDAGIALPQDGPVHPRFYGAFPREIRQFAIDQALMTIEQAVRAGTTLPAEILGLTDRGELTVGNVADVVVFDEKTIRDRSDAFHPHRFARESITCPSTVRWRSTKANGLAICLVRFSRRLNQLIGLLRIADQD